MPTRSKKLRMERNLSNQLHNHPFFEKEEPKFLTNILRKLPSNPLILEIGTFRGMSAILIAVNRRDAKIITIDSHIGMPEFEYLDSSASMVLKNLKKAGVFERVSHYPLPSQEFNYLSQRLDLLFIDGDHTFEGVSHDYYKFLPWVKKGGWILFHDFGTHEGVTTLCNRITVNKRYLRFKSMLAIQK